MQRRLSWLLKPLKDRIWVDREHAPLPRIAGEEDPRLDLEHLFKVGDGIPLEIRVVDEELVDVAAADGAVNIKVVEHRHSRNLAYNATIVANMGIILVNVLKEPVVLAAAEQHKVSISEVISLRHEEVHDRDVRWSKFVGTGKERNTFPFTKDLSLARFFSFFLFIRMGLSSLS